MRVDHLIAILGLLVFDPALASTQDGGEVRRLPGVLGGALASRPEARSAITPPASAPQMQREQPRPSQKPKARRMTCGGELRFADFARRPDHRLAAVETGFVVGRQRAKLDRFGTRWVCAFGGVRRKVF